ncbi:MAG: hypothetical protein EP318_06090 [Rhodobacteraceae bacterium]|nr:MAG: hypothetical protein EP318_06090 [Paracoccaceae bacterium]
MSDPFERKSVAEERQLCLDDLATFEQFLNSANTLYGTARALIEASKEEQAMRAVQRLRFALQFQADMTHCLLADLHFVATGSDDFDHEAWLAATEERDYSALGVAQDPGETARYLSGTDLGGDHND